MGSLKLITSFLLSYLVTVNCGPINKRHLSYHLATDDYGSTHLAFFPTIIAGRTAISPLPLRYAESIPNAGGPSGAFGYEFTVQAPSSLPHIFPIAKADDCSHTATLIAPPETAHLPVAPLPPPPPPPPPPPAPIVTDCHEAPTLTEFAPIAAIPPPPPPPPSELLPPTLVHTEPCLETAQAPILTAPAPIYTEPAQVPLPPPSHIITEPLKSPGCIETAPAPTFVSAPQAEELAPPPPPHLESPTFGEQINALDCHGAAPVTTSFTYPSQPLEPQYNGDASPIASPSGEAEESLPEIFEARSMHPGFGGRTGISHPFSRLAKMAKH